MSKTYSQRHAAAPERTSEHYPFYECLRNGGRVWRDDKLNGVKEWIDLNHPGIQGHAANIVYFGYLSLSLTHDETSVKQALEQLEASMKARGWKEWPGQGWGKGGGRVVNLFGFMHAVKLQIEEDEHEAVRERAGG